MAQPKVHILDIIFQGETKVIACFLLESEDGLILIETGPVTAWENLKAAAHEAGFDWQDIKHVLLTHIHFDHAGAAWKFAENGAKIYVHPFGLPHLNQPEKLWHSAKRIYKDDMESLWGEMKPIPKHLLVALEDGDEPNIGGLNFKVHYTPGHAIHHNAYQLGDIIFTGDVAGVKINNGPVVPPCPPPDINIEAWKKSIEKLRFAHPKALYLTHFGFVAEANSHFDQLEEMLADWSGWMKPHFDNNDNPEDITPEFVAYSANQLRDAGVSEANIEKYEKGNPSYMSVTGLLRYWKLKDQRRI